MKDFREKILRGENSSKLENYKVVDLAGNECTLASAAQHEAFELTEDQVSLRKSQIQLQALFHRKDYHSTRKLQINQELSQIESEKQECFKKFNKLKAFQEQAVEVITELKSSKNLSSLERLEQPQVLISKFSKLSEQNSKIFRDFNFNGILARQLLKCLKEDYKQVQWNLLQNSAFNFDIFSELRAHLQCCDHQNRALGQEEEDEGVFFGKPSLSSQHDIHYLRIVFEEAWLPAVKTYFRKQWDPTLHPGLPSSVYQAWKSILPKQIAHFYCDHFYPTFQDNPAIMLANHPQIVLKESLEQCFEQKVAYEIKRDLRKRRWHKNYQQICQKIKQWKPVLSSQIFENFVLTGLIPRLGAHIQQMEINPSGQDISALEMLFYFKSEEIISEIQAFSILKNHFLSRWLIVLQNWSSQKEKRKQEIAEWFRGWRQFLSEQLGKDSHLVFYLRMGLFIIHKNI